MRIITVPILTDNYAYLVIDKHGTSITIDPAEPDKVLWAASRQRSRLEAVLTTHNHRDHAGGNKRLAQHLPELEIVGGTKDRVPACTLTVEDGEKLEVGDLIITCLETPYHTAGHICYMIREKGLDGPAVLFTGDVLFIGGCGRRFQGTSEQMYHSLVGVLAKLPPETLVYCGHEYTVSNLEFAVTVEASNPAINAKLEWARQQREKGLTTVPSTIGEELQHNVFLRCHERTVQQHCGTYPGSEAVAVSADTPRSEGLQQRPDDSSAGEGRSSNTIRQCGLEQSHLPLALSGDAEGAVIQTMAELRRRKDNFGTLAKVVTTVLGIGSWFGWTP